MILAFSLTLLLWQGSFSQPQLDGRYGVDRVAFEQKAQEAAKSDTLVGKSTVSTLTFKSKSPQITAVRAVAHKCQIRDIPRFELYCGLGEHFDLKGLMAKCEEKTDCYTCPAKHILAESEDGSEHWCLKISQ